MRDDLPLHDITGGSTWFPSLLPTLYPDEVNEAALQSGIARARYMLQNAAEMSLTQEDSQLKVTITNNTGHKLPTGYPEGRRVWIQREVLQRLDGTGSANPADMIRIPRELSHDAEAKIYDIEPGLG